MVFRKTNHVVVEVSALGFSVLVVAEASGTRICNSVAAPCKLRDWVVAVRCANAVDLGAGHVGVRCAEEAQALSLDGAPRPLVHDRDSVIFEVKVDVQVVGRLSCDRGPASDAEVVAVAVRVVGHVPDAERVSVSKDDRLHHVVAIGKVGWDGQRGLAHVFLEACSVPSGSDRVVAAGRRALSAVVACCLDNVCRLIKERLLGCTISLHLAEWKD
mmetsp:Transcript_9260/g.13908  ORF Transcript_9260/g.13908 Transcript_9260/m.13908 type:complete len:215 (+) Transcript_9260:551-1195(+)